MEGITWLYFNLKKITALILDINHRGVRMKRVRPIMTLFIIIILFLFLFIIQTRDVDSLDQGGGSGSDKKLSES